MSREQYEAARFASEVSMRFGQQLHRVTPDSWQHVQDRTYSRALSERVAEEDVDGEAPR